MNSEETLEQPTRDDEVLKAIAELSQKIDGFQKDKNSRFEAVDAQLEAVNAQFDRVNAQLEAVRQGIVDNSARFDRLEASFLLMRASVTELTEEVRHNRKVLV